MALVIDATTEKFDLSKLTKGALVFARHRTWPEGKGGFLTSVTEQELIVQYYPGMSCITNHFYLLADEVAAGEWEIRWSKDLTDINSYGGETL